MRRLPLRPATAIRVALTCSALLWGPVSYGESGRLPRHLIFISLDTARADRFGFLGNPVVHTPRLDAFARESIVFDDCMSAAPSTLASHTSLFTGKYPHSHGTPRNGFMVNRENRMLPELLKQAGFHTAAFLGSFALDRRFDFAQRFDHYDEDFEVFAGEGEADQNQRSAAGVTDAAIDYLDGIATPDRLFLFVHYFDAHQPYAAPAPFATLYDPAGRNGLPSMHELKTSSGMSPEQRGEYARRYERQYDAEISYLDENVGRLLSELRRRGILEDAMVVITSDHGENLTDHPVAFDHGQDVYQSSLRSVCVMRLPGGEGGGTRRRQLFSHVDVLPTVLGQLGIALPQGVEGEAVDLRAPEPGGSGPTRFAEATKPGREVETDPRWVNLRKARCVRQGR